MSFAGSGLIEPKLALALVIGANIGGALAPYMAQSGADVAARRVPLANLMTRAIVGVALLPFLGPVVEWLSLIDASATRLPVNFHTAFNVAGGAGLPAAGRRRRLGLPPPAARQAGGRRSRQAAPSRSQRARFAGRGAGLRAARDAEPRRPRGRHAAPDHRRVRAQRSQGGEGDRGRRQRRRPALRGDQALPHPDLAHRARRGGRQALCRDPDLHHQPRAYRRHHRQEPDGARRQEDQEPLRLLARGHGRAARPSMPACWRTCGWR